MTFISALDQALLQVTRQLGRPNVPRAPVAAYVELFEAWNQKINLSAARTREAIELQVSDAVHAVVPLRQCRRILDVGAGGGLPGVLVATFLPDAVVVSLEPVHKKHAFLRTVARTLGLKNYQVHARRLVQTDVGFDGAVSRATFALGEWLELGQAAVVAGGVVVGMEGLEQVKLTDRDVRRPYVVDGKTRALIVRSVG